MCRASCRNVRVHHQSLPDVLADHVAGDLAEDVPAQVQEPRAPAQSQGRVQGRAVRARRRVLRGLVVGHRGLPPRPHAATAATPGRGRPVVGEKESRQETAAVEQIKVHGQVGHIRPDGRHRARQLSPRVQVHGQAGRIKTGSFSSFVIIYYVYCSTASVLSYVFTYVHSILCRHYNVPHIHTPDL